jgi:hypothetical protein
VGEEPAGSVGQLVSGLANTAEGLKRLEQAGRAEYSRSGRPFLVVDSDRVRFRLRKDVARAGLTTPGTSPDPQGPEWIALESDRSDRFSLDRARAWFEFALRQTAGG